MKNLYIILIALLIGSGAMAQTAQPCSTCLPQGITFSTQAQIDNFQTNYPNCTEIEGNVTIRGSADITNLNGLSGLTSIGGELRIERCSVLTNLTGLNNLTSIGGYLHIYNNDALTNLTGLDNLTSIGDDLEILRNNALTNLKVLDNIDAGTITGIRIWENHSLSDCAARSICDWLAAPTGIVEIHDNAMGCNSRAEVEDACVYVAAGGLNIQSSLTFYPNPASNTIAIEYPNNTMLQKNTWLTIYNLNSQQLIQRAVTEPLTVVDVSELSSGIYFVKVISDNGVMVGKFVKE